MPGANPNWKKGMKKVKNSGRKKGVQNKFTTLKQAYLDAFNSKEIGGSDGIVEAFKPSAFTKRDFFKLIAKMLPTNVGVEHSGELTVNLKWVITDKKPEE